MEHAFAYRHEIHAFRQPDAEIAALAERQHGLVSRAQLRDLGLGKGAIEHRVRRRSLHRVHPQVYAVGHRRLGPEGRWMAAVLAAGAAAALSHWSAGTLWKMRSGRGPRSHVTIPRRRRNAAAITFHYAELADDEVTVKDGIPVTVPTRTLLDLAPYLSLSSLTRALERMERQRLHAAPSLAELLERYPRRAGTPDLRALMGKPVSMSRSELEVRFRELVEEWQLPRPQMNVNVLGYEVDAVWWSQRVIVELDTLGTHGSSFAFERDRLRDRRLQAAGWTVIRITARQLEEDAEPIRADLARLLSR